MSQMAYTKIREDTFQTLAINAGVLLTSFDPSAGSVSEANILGATSGGINFTAQPSFVDFGENVDNCPKNTKELKRLDDWEIKVSGTFVTVSKELARRLIGLADIDGTDTTKIVPRDTLNTSTDFPDLWLVCDYSDVNTGASPGHVAIHMKNVLSTGGFQIQTADKEKGKFSFEFTCHYSSSAQDVVPFAVYIKAGTDASAPPEILLADHTITIAKDATYKLEVMRLTPADSTITWASSTTAKATVSNGTVTGVAAGSSIITASITVDSVTYSDTCTVIVTAAS